MRVLILCDRIPPEHQGGAEKVAWALAYGLRDAGHDVHVIAATDKMPFEEKRDGILTYHIHAQFRSRFQPYYMLYNPQTAAPLRRLYKQIRPDVINAHNVQNGLSYYCMTLANRMGIPVIFSSHDVMPFAYNRISYFVDSAHCGVISAAQYQLPRFHNLKEMRLRYNPIRNPIIRYTLSNHVRIRTCVSEAHRQALAANQLPPFQVVYNGLRASAFQATQTAVSELRSHLGLNGRKVILFAGRLSPDKGSYQLIAALKHLITDIPNVSVLLLSRIDMAESGIDDPEYRLLCESKHILSGGWLSGNELAAAYGLADVVCVPSIYLDPFPTVNLEAMAAGKPVVATCFGGSPEAVVDGETGYVVNPFDTRMLAERLKRLLTDDNLRKKMGVAGRQRIQDHFRLERQVSDMLQIFEEVTH